MELIHYFLIAIFVIQALHLIFYLSPSANKYQLQTTLDTNELLKMIGRDIAEKLYQERELSNEILEELKSLSGSTQQGFTTIEQRHAEVDSVVLSRLENIQNLIGSDD